jgi:hypothetical protein
MRSVSAALLVAVTASAAPAQQGPVIVIPGRPDVPIFENGVNVTWSVVEGEFGLDRPGQVTPTVIYRLPPPVISTYLGAAVYEPGYFPKDGRKPGYGRLEVNPGPNRPLPPPAQSYRRSWSSESAPTPADLPNPNPTVISPFISPNVGPGPWWGGRGPGAGPGMGPGMGPGTGPGGGHR